MDINFKNAGSLRDLFFLYLYHIPCYNIFKSTTFQWFPCRNAHQQRRKHSKTRVRNINFTRPPCGPLPRDTFLFLMRNQTRFYAIPFNAQLTSKHHNPISHYSFLVNFKRRTCYFIKYV